MNVEEEINNFDIDKVNDDLLKEVDETYDQIITQQLPEPTKKEMNETTKSNIKLIENEDIKRQLKYGLKEVQKHYLKI
jgi:hypothetical protein